MSADKLAFIAHEIAALKEQGLLINIRTIQSAQGAWTVVDGKKVLNLCSNNYLGLANHPRLKEAAQRAIGAWGVGPAAVRSIAGTMDLHLQFEERMAHFKGVEGVVSFQSGFNANLAVIPALVEREDGIFSDELNHASIIDGCRLSRATIERFPHCDPEGLERVLRQKRGDYRRAIVITDGVFSMDGDVAPLDREYEVAERYGCLLMVDDAHGEGVMGHGGRGIVDHYHLHGKVDVEVGTLSKAFGVMGGVVAGKKLVTDYMRQRARPFLFSSAATPADVAACLAAVDVLEESTELVDRLWENTRTFRAEIKRLGFDTANSVTPIIPVMLGEAPLAIEFSRQLFAEGVFAMALGFPTVPRGQARIRVMISAALAPGDIAFGLQAFQRVGQRLGVIP